VKTIEWINGTVATYDTASAWTGGVVPNAADTAVISSAGDPAPTENTSTGLLTPGTGSSEAYLAGLALASSSETLVPQSNGETYVYFTTPQVSTLAAGESVSGGTLDLIGAGSEAALYLQNSKLAPGVLNVGGDAYIYGGYSNTLSGDIDIGTAFSVNGTLVPAAPKDVNGFTSALYIGVQEYGSWSGEGVANGYTPSTTNTGKITIGNNSALWLTIDGGPAGVTKAGKYVIFTPKSDSAFVNTGSISLRPGATLHANSDFGEGTFTNNGTITITGAAGDTTGALIYSKSNGTGHWIISGGSQTNAGDTYAGFASNVSGQSFSVRDATLQFYAGQGIEVGGLVASGGTVTLGGNAVLQINAPVDDPVTTVFTDALAGFAPTDVISLSYGLLPIPSGESWAPSLTWNASTNTLDLTNVYVSSGVTSTSLEATFTLTGAYKASDFSIKSAAWNGGSGPATVDIVTSAASAIPADFHATDWSAGAWLADAARGEDRSARTDFTPSLSDLLSIGHVPVEILPRL
jgi:hypothetical protein